MRLYALQIRDTTCRGGWYTCRTVEASSRRRAVKALASAIAWRRSPQWRVVVYDYEHENLA